MVHIRQYVVGAERRSGRLEIARAVLVLRVDEPTRPRPELTVSRVEAEREVLNVHESVIDSRIHAPCFVSTKEREIVARAARAPSLAAQPERERRIVRPECRRVDTSTVPAEVVEVVAFEKECGETTVRLGKLPRLDLRHFIE